MLSAARHRLQYPIARAARAIQLASDKRDEYEAILSAGEAAAITVGASIAAAFRGAPTPPSAFEELQSAFVSRGVSQGHWISVIGATNAMLKDHPEPMSGLAEATRLGPKGSGLVADLRVLVEERNRWAHGGGPRSAAEAGARINEMAPAVEGVFQRSMFLADSPWILVRASSFRRNEGDFSVLASDAMAEHPDFERRDFFSPVPLANETFYMLTGGGPIDLTPFVVMHDCPECHQSELCHADRLDSRDGVILKSFARGHVMSDRTLTAEVEHLFVRTDGTGGSAA